VVALMLGSQGMAGAAEGQTQSLEMRVEAAFLYSFARFVEWPDDLGASASAPVTFCVLGAAPLEDALEQSLAGKTINGHPVLARRIAVPEDTLQCRVAFIGWDEKKRLPAILEVLNSAQVLTVADFEQIRDSWRHDPAQQGRKQVPFRRQRGRGDPSWASRQLEAPATGGGSP
jgi:hypothetical protein